MSWEATSWALTVNAGSPSAKCVLLCIANYVDENWQGFPSQERIAAQTEQSIDSVQRRLAELESRGLIRREKRYVAGKRMTDLITLLAVFHMNHNLTHDEVAQ